MESSNLPLVSVVIPCYNHEQFVQDSIQSVIDQTYLNIELIIIDDGSKDNSVDKIQQLIPACEQRFTRFEFRSRPNKGLSATLNEALTWCEGEYYSAIASDDQMLSNKTSLQVAYLNNNKECMAVFGGVQLIDENNKEIGSRITQSRNYTFKEIILNKHDLPASTQLARLNSIQEMGGYNEKVKIEDWYMLLKMTLKNSSEVSYLGEALCRYRFHENNFSKNQKTMTFEMEKILEDYKEHELYKYALVKIYRLEFSYYRRKKRYAEALLALTKSFLIKLKNK